MTCPPWPKGKKLVHLDLKGAPPRVDYLHRLIDLFSQLGVDGLLVEYEDMFPYEGELKLLQATTQPAYSREEVLSMQELAKSKGMEVIPLVQTFGHMERRDGKNPDWKHHKLDGLCMAQLQNRKTLQQVTKTAQNIIGTRLQSISDIEQFVLKHRPMWSLREVPYCVGTLNPHKEEGVKLVMEMLRQVVKLHPGLKTLHIGADEVYILGEGEESKQWLASPGHTVEQLFLSHVTKLAKAIKVEWPHMNIIMWDDMMRGMSEEVLKASGLVGLVKPMLWDYTPNLDVDKTVSLLEKYCSAGMSDLWVASSFKGSTSVYTCVPTTQRHVDNHLQWLKVAASLSAGVNLQGIALTGWQRYDHLSVLCELMPVALPSLAACLQTLEHGQLNTEAQNKVTEKLGIASVEVEAMGRFSEGDSLFPGRRLAELIVELNSLVNSEDIRSFENDMFVRGWFSPYHRQRKMVTPLITMQIHSQASTFLATLQQKVEAVREEMVRLFPDSTAQEWIEEHVSPVSAPLQRITEDIRACVKEMVP